MHHLLIEWTFSVKMAPSKKAPAKRSELARRPTNRAAKLSHRKKIELIHYMKRQAGMWLRTEKRYMDFKWREDKWAALAMKRQEEASSAPAAQFDSNSTRRRIRRSTVTTWITISQRRTTKRIILVQYPLHGTYRRTIGSNQRG